MAQGSELGDWDPSSQNLGAGAEDEVRLSPFWDRS